GVADGVLGVTLGTDITLVNGWNWYLGADPTQVGSDQYDLQSIVSHELGHAVGLGHSTDSQSVMYPYLTTGEAKRDLTASDRGSIDGDAVVAPEPLLAAGFSAPGVRDIAAQPAVVNRDVAERTPTTEKATGIMAQAPTGESLFISSLVNFGPAQSTSVSA